MRTLHSLPALLFALITLATFAAPPTPATTYSPGPPLLKDLPRVVEIGACSAVALDRDDNLYLLHRGRTAVVKLSADGTFKDAWGADVFKLAHGLRIDADGNLWTTDVDNHVVYKFSPDGKLLLTLGVKGTPGEDETHFNKPADVAFAPSGDLFVADGYGNSRVVKFDKTGKFLTAWGKKGTAAGEFDLPHNIRLDSKGNVYVADRENNRIQVFDQQGKFLRQFNEARRPLGAATDGSPIRFSPFGLSITPDDTLYISDGRANRVLVLDTNGNLLTTFGSTGAAPGQLNLPHGLTVSPRTGVVYVTEVTNKRLQQFVPSVPRAAVNGSDRIRIACVGDSITFGSGIKDRDRDAYPAQLQSLLGDAYDVRNFGVSGATLLQLGDKPYWKERAFQAAAAFAPHQVMIKLGTNDTKPQNWKHKAAFEADAIDLIRHFQRLSSKPTVYVCLPVPAYPGDWGIDDATIRDEMIPLLQQSAKETGATVIDLYAALSDHPEFFPDKVHPNADGAKLMARTIHQAILRGATAPSR